MPSVLIELGFISNREEERFLLSAEGQQKMAQSIFSAFERYKHEYDKRTYTQQTAIKPITIDITIAAVEETPTAKQADEIVYKVQIFSTNKKLKPTDAAFKGWKECSFYEETGLIKYTYGATSNYNEIVALKKKVNKDFKDAFIVAFVNGKKIAVGEARKLQQSKK